MDKVTFVHGDQQMPGTRGWDGEMTFMKSGRGGYPAAEKAGGENAACWMWESTTALAQAPEADIDTLPGCGKKEETRVNEQTPLEDSPLNGPKR